jgi:tetraacyldisaccharide 4'-kinase
VIILLLLSCIEGGEVMRIKKLELYLKDIVYGRRRGLLAYFMRAILLPLSWMYGWGVYFRNRLYEKGWMRRYVPPVPLVISVGNIVAGGTGKTPVTLMLASAFYERFNIALLSRGYRSQAENLDNPLLLCEGNGPLYPASYCGDESYLLAQRFPKALVIVGGNRKKSSFLAAKAGVQAIFLDDGMQHRRVVRDFDVVVVDAEDPFGLGYFLPRGFLRDDICSLSRANLIVLNHIQDLEHFGRAKAQLKAFTSAPVVGMKGQIIAFRDLKGQEAAKLAEKKVGMFCSIARPEYFKRTLQQEGYQVVNEWILPDHDQIPTKKLEQFALACSKLGAQAIICTEKDRVKLQDQINVSLPIIWAQLELQIVAGQEEWKNFIKLAETKILT